MTAKDRLIEKQKEYIEHIENLFGFNTLAIPRMEEFHSEISALEQEIAEEEKIDNNEEWTNNICAPDFPDIG